MRKFSFTSWMVCIQLALGLVLFCNAKGLSQTPDRLPKFSFVTLDGASLTEKAVDSTLSNLFVLFDVGCSHCQKEVAAIGKHYSDFKKVHFYLVSLDDTPSIEKFMSTYGKELIGKTNVTVLRDDKLQFIPTFLPKKYPALIGYGSHNRLLFSKSGQTPIEQILKDL